MSKAVASILLLSFLLLAKISADGQVNAECPEWLKPPGWLRFVGNSLQDGMNYVVQKFTVWLDPFRQKNSPETSPGPCPEINTFANFDGYLFQGRWYAVLRSNFSNEDSNYGCFYMNVTNNMNRSLRIEDVSYLTMDSSKKVSNNLATLNPNGYGNWSIQYQDYYGGMIVKPQVLSVDYEDYAVVYICTENVSHGEDVTHTQKAIVYSRTPRLSISGLWSFHRDLLMNPIGVHARLFHVDHSRCPTDSR